MLRRLLQTLRTPTVWLQDDLLRRLFGNAAILLSGNVLTSIFGFASLGLTARALGAEQLGILVLITTYVLVVDKLVNFQSWQAMIKFGADALEQRRDEDFKPLVKFAFMLDASTAVAAAILAASAAFFFGKWAGWDDHTVLLAALYSLTLLVHVGGVPTGVLRLFGQFRLLASQQVIAAIIKLSGVLAAYLADAGLFAFLLVWAAADVAANLLLVVFAIHQMRQRGITRYMSSSVANISKRFTGLWPFFITTNMNIALRSAIREADVLLVGALLGPAATGLFKIAKSLAAILTMIADPLYASAYPEIARLISAGRLPAFRSYAIRASLISGAVGLSLYGVIAALSHPLLGYVFGPEYRDAYVPLLVYMTSYLVWICLYPLSAAILAFGRPTISLIVLVVSAAFYYPALYLLTLRYGLIGASASSFVFYGVWGAMMMLFVTKEYWRRENLLKGASQEEQR